MKLISLRLTCLDSEAVRKYGVDELPAQSAFLEKIKRSGLNHFHIVAPDIAMPVAMHYVMFREHAVKSIIIGDDLASFHPMMEV